MLLAIFKIDKLRTTKGEIKGKRKDFKHCKLLLCVVLVCQFLIIQKILNLFHILLYLNY